MKYLLLAMLCLLSGASSAGTVLGPSPVTIESADGVKIHGWYIHPGSIPHDVVHEADASSFAEYPAVVLLHMYRGDKSDWGPIFGEFFGRDIAALAIDMRGHGESTIGIDGEDLSIKVMNRDNELFNSMWQEATAAVDWLVAKGHRKDRIGILGASIGCSVAIDAARRDPELRVVATLSPGSKYLEVDTLAHLKSWGDRSLLIVSSEKEWASGAKQVAQRLEQLSNAVAEGEKPVKPADVWKLDGTDSKVHGTRMLGRIEGIERRLVDWFSSKLSPTDDKDENSKEPNDP